MKDAAIGFLSTILFCACLLLLLLTLAGCGTIKNVNTSLDAAIDTASKADVSEAEKLAGTLDPAGAKCAAAYGQAVDILTLVSCSGGPLCLTEKARVMRILQNAVRSNCVGVTVP